MKSLIKCVTIINWSVETNDEFFLISDHIYGCNLLAWWHGNGTIAGSTFTGLPTWMADRIIWCIVWWYLRRNHNWWRSIFAICLPKCPSAAGFQLHGTTSQLRWRWRLCCWWWSNSIRLTWYLSIKSKLLWLTLFCSANFSETNSIFIVLLSHFTCTADTRCFCFACKPWPMSSKME